MGKRKGESYLGGNTVITLHPKIVEDGLVEQALEHKRQARYDQQQFDEFCEKKTNDANLKDYRSYAPTRRARDNAEQYYRQQIYNIERQLNTKPHPRIKVPLLLRQLELLEKLLSMAQAISDRRHKNSVIFKITQRIHHARGELKQCQ